MRCASLLLAASLAACTIPFKDKPVSQPAAPSGAGTLQTRLEVEMRGDRRSLAVGDTLVVHFVVTNHGPGDAADLLLDVILPPELSFVEGSGPSRAVVPRQDDGVKRVRFAPVTNFPAGVSGEWDLILRADRAGRADIHVQVLTRLPGGRPLEVSTRVQVVP